MKNSVAPGYRVLVIEDEFIIADSIERHLRRHGHSVTAKPISYEEAVAAYRADRPDLALIDIRLSGPRSGIDFARYLNEQPQAVPFIFLTSQTDSATLDRAKETFPAGYLSKPVQMASLLSTLEIAIHNFNEAKAGNEAIAFRDGRETHVVSIADIRYLQSEHVYAHVHLRDRQPLTLRASLAELFRQLPVDRFLQPHRSYVVNRDHITRYEREYLYLGNVKVPVSRNRRAEVFDTL